MRLSALALLSLLPLTAYAREDAPPPATASVTRLFNHLPYGEAAPGRPTPARAGAARLRHGARGGTRSRAIARRGACGRNRARCPVLLPFDRASAPCILRRGRRLRRGSSVAGLFRGASGYSEHATGYAIDFVQRGEHCRAVEQCFASTPGGQWLMRRAPEFGFELSFPAGNKQGVGWEPWHWRWVGRPAPVPASPRRRRASRRFPPPRARKRRPDTRSGRRPGDRARRGRLRGLDFAGGSRDLVGQLGDPAALVAGAVQLASTRLAAAVAVRRWWWHHKASHPSPRRRPSVPGSHSRGRRWSGRNAAGW